MIAIDVLDLWRMLLNNSFTKYVYRELGKLLLKTSHVE